jgi:molybdenum cofactor biosynthesis enzyme MoaA
MEIIERAGDGYYEVDPENSQFYTVGVDITHKCNMECANCYSPVRDIPDVGKQDLVSFFRRLGRRTEIRFTGGEPTLRPDLTELILEARSSGHRVSIMTNGLKLSDLSYCRTLKEAGLKFIAISMNGADDDEVYKVIDGRKCASIKMQALRNMAELGFFININCIVAKGINEHVPARLNNILNELGVHGVIRIRNIGKLGRHMSGENFTFDELINLMCKSFNKKPEGLRVYNKVNGYEEEHNVLFPIEENKKLSTTWIKITDWRPSETSIPDPKSLRRGRMTKDLKVAPFFEHAKINGY